MDPHANDCQVSPVLTKQYASQNSTLALDQLSGPLGQHLTGNTDSATTSYIPWDIPLPNPSSKGNKLFPVTLSREKVFFFIIIITLILVSYMFVIVRLEFYSYDYLFDGGGAMGQNL
ncbi:hypothetical protein TNCT_409971 [Trichonephila clavata]|uniref:Uncharacterized protein n=1 Tax=Trichonephila clavata TaxID=2740835 RepID=A0A8X6G9F8_TRICU|nr:hypothetical protein TNCT_409971 [Trichonephila clavata]